MSKFSALAAGFTALLLSAQFASAQTAAPSGSPMARPPCKVELEKFCATVERGGRNIKCLQEHTADLYRLQERHHSSNRRRRRAIRGAAAAEKQ